MIRNSTSQTQQFSILNQQRVRLQILYISFIIMNAILSYPMNLLSNKVIFCLIGMLYIIVLCISIDHPIPTCIIVLIVNIIGLNIRDQHTIKYELNNGNMGFCLTFICVFTWFMGLVKHKEQTDFLKSISPFGMIQLIPMMLVFVSCYKIYVSQSYKGLSIPVWILFGIICTFIIALFVINLVFHSLIANIDIILCICLYVISLILVINKVPQIN